MTYVTVAPPPGFYRNGTKYQGKGRWVDGSLVRFFEGTIRPVGGWTELIAEGQTSISVSYLDDDFDGALNEDLADHLSTKPAGGVWLDATSAFKQNGDGALIQNTTDGLVHVAYLDADLAAPAVGQEWWFEMTFPLVVAATGSNWGLVFLKSKTNGEEFWLRLFPTQHAGDTGFDFFNGILMESWSLLGASEPSFSEVLSYTHPSPGFVPGASYRFGVTAVTTTTFDVWYEPAGGGTRVVMATFVGTTPPLPNRITADHVRMGIVAEEENEAIINFLRVHSEVPFTTTEITLEGVPRAIIGWKGDDGNQVMAIGTNEKLYAHTVGILYDITPEDFVPGTVDTKFFGFSAAEVAVYGAGNYGDGLYGTADPAQQAVVPAAVWHLDTFGEYLLGCCAPNDGRIYFWTKDPETIAQRIDGSGGVLTSDGQLPSNGDTVTIGSRVYTFQSAGIGHGDSANRVHIGINVEQALRNLAAAINGSVGRGAYYSWFTPENTDITATSNETQLVILTTNGGGVSLVTTETSSHLSWGSGAVTAADGQGTPTHNRGVVVTPERFVFALGADGLSRRVRWASQESLTDWTPTELNTAGGFNLEGVGTIVAGRRTKGETLIWTDDDVHAARYIGGILVYQFDKVGSKCGLVAPGAVSLIDTKAVWMGNKQFHIYDGYVKNIPCEVSDFVFEKNDDIPGSGFNYSQKQKVTSYSLSIFGQIFWHYPSAESSENDRYVAWSWREGTWTTGELPRTCGADAGAMSFPVLGAPNGKLYEHEKGLTKLDLDGEPIPFNEIYMVSGPIELGNGDAVMDISQILPDERRLGDVQLSLYVSNYPMRDEELIGPFTVNELTDARTSGRWCRVRIEQLVEGDWRYGRIRLDASPAGLR